MNTEPITPRPPASLATSQRGNAPPPQPPRTAPAGGSHAHQLTLFPHTNRGQLGQVALLTDTQSYGGTVRSSPALLDAMNTTLGSSRQRHETHLQQRVANLKERDRKRTELVQGYHSHRQGEMVQQLDHLAKREDHAYEYLTEVHEAQHERTMELKYQEIERRREFSGRRVQRLSSREEAAEALREAVYTTPHQNRFPKNNSPKVMSREVVDRLLIMPVATSPRALGAAESNAEVGNSDPSSQPPVETSKEALTRLQAQRDAQVEHHRHQQEQSLSEKKLRREEHLHALKERLDGIVHNAQDDNRRRQRKRREEEERIAAWRWRKQHALRAEAIDRLTAHTAGTENDAQQTTASETQGHQAAPQVEEKRDQSTVDKSSSQQQRKRSPQTTAARTSPRKASPRTGTTAVAAESSEEQPTQPMSESTAQRSGTKSSSATRHQQDMKAYETRSTAAPTAATETAPQQAKPQKPTVARSEPKKNQRRHQEDKVIEASGESQPREVSGDDTTTTAQAGRAAVAIAKPQPPLRPKEDSAAVSRKPAVNKKETKAQGDQHQPQIESETSKPTSTTAVVESSSKGSSRPTAKVTNKSKKSETIPAKSTTSIAKAAEETTVEGAVGSEETVTSTEVTVVEKKAAATDSKTNSSKNVKKSSKDVVSPPPKKSAASSKTRTQPHSASEAPPAASTATPPAEAVGDDDGKVVVASGDSRPVMMLPRPTSASASAKEPPVHSDTITPLKPHNTVVTTSMDQSTSSVVDPAAYAAAAINAAQGTAANRAASPTSNTPRASHLPPRPHSGSRSIPSPPPAAHNNAASTSASTPLKQSTHSLLDQSGSSVLDPAAYAAGAIAAAEHSVAGNSETDTAARSSSPGRSAPLPPRPDSGSRQNASKAPNSANETPLLKPYTPMQQSSSVDPAAFAAKAIAVAEGTHHQEAGASQQQPPLVPSRGNSATRRSPSPNATPILSAAGSPLQKAKTTTNNTSLHSATGGGLKNLDQSSSVVDPAAFAAGAIAAAQQTANLPGVATPLHSQSGKMDQSSSVVDPAAFAAMAIAAAEVSNAEHHSRADVEDEVPVGIADMSM